MNIISKMPIHIDYVMGILMILAGIYRTYAYVDVLIEYPEFVENLYFDIAPYVILIICGIVMIMLPGKNLRRTIWLCALFLGLNLIAMGYAEYDEYTILKGLYIGFDDRESIVYLAKSLAFTIIHFGCGIALLINSVAFATKRTHSIYVMIIAIVLSIWVDYMQIRLQQEYMDFGMYFIRSVLSHYIPHMFLFGFFTMVFTSNEVSWYTAKGDMYRALNRLRTVNGVFGVYTINRAQLITLMQADHDCTVRLRQGKAVCSLEMRVNENGKQLVFARNGTASLASAVYLDSAVFYIPSLSESNHVDIYGAGGMHIRLKIVEPKRKIIRGSVSKSELSRRVVTKFKYSVPNSFLYHLNDDTAECSISRKGKEGKPNRIVISGTGDDKNITVYLPDGQVFTSMELRAMVPVEEFGAYTKLYLYGDMGNYLAFKVKLPKHNQVEKPDKIE